MRIRPTDFLICSVAVCLAWVLAACGSGDGASRDTLVVQAGEASITLQFEGAGEVDRALLQGWANHPAVTEYVSQVRTEEQAGALAATEAQAAAPVATAVPAVNETPLPHTTRPPIGVAESLLTRAYLESPNDGTLTSFIAYVCLAKSMVSTAGGGNGERFKYTLLARYFLERTRDLGRLNGTGANLLERTRAAIAQTVNRGSAITVAENHPAHRYFNTTFNERESTRYTALALLLDDFVAEPRNVYTAFTLTAANLWIGGEAEFDDPTVLHNFVVGSFLSLHTMELAQQLEVAWLADNRATPRFRMASILGGFSILQRRWLARLHGDDSAVQALDDEHRAWRLVHRSFHAFTLGLGFFEEPQNFAEGLTAWQDGFAHCLEVPVRTCSNLPRFSHNFQSYILGYVDFLLKAGQVQPARQLLSIRFAIDQFPPMAAYAAWNLGRASWEYREIHAEEIAAAYGNTNPADDPMNFMMRRKRWGTDTATCQVCHQAQGSVWTQAEKDQIVLPPEPVATVGRWPAVATTWYGGRLPAP